jgi:hypothetical protein
MPSLLTYCYPTLDISRIKALHELMLRQLPPDSPIHPPMIPLLWGCSTIPMAEYRLHIEGVAASTKRFSVTTGAVALESQSGSKIVHLVLALRDGANEVRDLRSRLHTGQIASAIGDRRPTSLGVRVLTVRDANYAQKLADQINEEIVELQGDVSEICVLSDYSGHVEIAERHPLQL